MTRPSNRVQFTVIQGCLRSPHEWSDTELLRLIKPSIKALPFVKPKKNAEPMWHPESGRSVPIAT